MRRTVLPLLLLLALVVTAGTSVSCGSGGEDLPRYDYRIVRTLPHDADAYCQGFLHHDGAFYESTGRLGTSSIRRVEIETGEVLLKKDLPPTLFGEGLVLHDGELVQLTWKAGKANVFDLETFKTLRTATYDGEGWGLTSNGEVLIMSNGTSRLSIRDPKTFEELRNIQVTLRGGKVPELNELECELWANVWKYDQIARIDLNTGEVVGVIHLEGIYDYSKLPDPDSVLNGIAYDDEEDRIYVTGKLWPHVFEIELVPRD